MGAFQTIHQYQEWSICIFILNNFLLGPQYVTHMAVQLELNLHILSYDGERRDPPLHKFVNFHKGQNIIADVLMEYVYSGVDDIYKVHMLINGINTNALDDCKVDTLATPEMQRDFEISARHFLDFISMTPSLQNNSTAKVSSVIRNGGERGVRRGSDRGSVMPDKSDVQASMGAIKKKYFREYERGYVPTAKYKKMSKAQQQAVYRICQEQYGIISPAARTCTPNYYANLKCQVSAFDKNVDDFLTTYYPSSDEDSDKNQKVKFGGNKLNPALGHQ